MSYAVNLFERLGQILPCYVICGNHDIWAKKSNDISSIDSLKWIPNVQVYKEPELLNWSGKKILLMPWRRDAAHETETLAEYPQANIVFCHSEVRGIYLNAKVKTNTVQRLTSMIDTIEFSLVISIIDKKRINY